MTAVMSVSLTPPALAICVNRTTLLHDILLGARDFCVNVLHEAQEPVSAAFSSALPPNQRFDRGNWAYTADGLGYLEDAQASIF